MSEENGKVCCSCGHNVRTDTKHGVECNCDIDGHYIGYIECMEHWCRRWKRDRTWDKKD